MAKVRTKREMRSRRKRFMAMAGTMDFLGVVGSCAVILCVHNAHCIARVLGAVGHSGYARACGICD